MQIKTESEAVLSSQQKNIERSPLLSPQYARFDINHSHPFDFPKSQKSGSQHVEGIDTFDLTNLFFFSIGSSASNEGCE